MFSALSSDILVSNGHYELVGGFPFKSVTLHPSELFLFIVCELYPLEIPSLKIFFNFLLLSCSLKLRWTRIVSWFYTIKFWYHCLIQKSLVLFVCNSKRRSVCYRVFHCSLPCKQATFSCGIPGKAYPDWIFCCTKPAFYVEI